jgi:hypothetical protein
MDFFLAGQHDLCADLAGGRIEDILFPAAGRFNGATTDIVLDKLRHKNSFGKLTIFDRIPRNNNEGQSVIINLI